MQVSIPFNSGQRIAIVGAGPAGLTAALTAHMLGLDVTVYEQSTDFSHIGGGILLHANGLLVLTRLGLLSSFTPYTHPVRVAVLEVAQGDPFFVADFGYLPSPYDQISVVMRSTLQEHLWNAAVTEGIRVLPGVRCVGYRTEAEGVILSFEGKSEHKYDAVVACDGIHSQMRVASSIKYKKIALGEAWLRGIADLPCITPTVREIWGNDGRRFGVAPLVDSKTYFYCPVPLGEWQAIRDAHLEEWIASWDTHGPEVLRVLHAVSDWRRVNYSELFEVRMSRWYRAPVFFAGDSAHAMTPDLGQGANSAMEDSLVLVSLLAHAMKQGGSLERVGQEYEKVRRSFVTRIQTSSRRLGKVAKLTRFPFRRAIISALSLIQSFDPIYRYSMQLTSGLNPCEHEPMGVLPSRTSGDA